MEEVGPQTIESNWQCGECGLMWISEHELSVHMKTLHTEIQEPVSRIVVLTPENCKDCQLKDEQYKELENRFNLQNDKQKSIVKELDLLKRRHDQLKQKHKQRQQKICQKPD